MDALAVPWDGLWGPWTSGKATEESVQEQRGPSLQWGGIGRVQHEGPWTVPRPGWPPCATLSTLSALGSKCPPETVSSIRAGTLSILSCHTTPHRAWDICRV